MPELPDVEVFKQYLDATALHQSVKRIEVRDTRILGDTSLRSLGRKLKGRSFESSRRHGKYLFCLLDGGALVLHFGMSGFLTYFKGEEDRGEADYNQMLLYFDNEYRLAYNSRRKLGLVDWTDDPDRFIVQHDLGPDCLGLDLEGFSSLLAEGRGALKPFLMNQSRISGLGNVYTDEILFQSGLHPKTAASSLNAKQQRRLYRQMRKVLAKAIECRANPERFPRSYLTPHRQGDGKCPRCGKPLRTAKVSGRTAYFCPRRQG